MGPSSSRSSIDEADDDGDGQIGACEAPPGGQNRSPSPVVARVKQEKDREYRWKKDQESGATDKGRYEDEAKVRTHATFLWRLRRGKESPNEYVKEVERQSSPSYGEENRDDWFVPWKPR